MNNGIHAKNCRQQSLGKYEREILEKTGYNWMGRYLIGPLKGSTVNYKVHISWEKGFFLMVIINETYSKKLVHYTSSIWIHVSERRFEIHTSIWKHSLAWQKLRIYLEIVIKWGPCSQKWESDFEIISLH